MTRNDNTTKGTTMNATITNTYRDQVNQRVTLSVRIARDDNGRPQAYHHHDGYYAVLEGCDGTKFEARIPLFGLSDFRQVSARIDCVCFNGTVCLKNVRLRKDQKKVQA
jgi:hypothetical protein